MALTPPFVENNETYSISIQEKLFFETRNTQNFKIDSINGKIHFIDIKQYSTQHILDTIYGPDKYYIEDVLINLRFDSNNGIEKEEFIEILKNEYEIE